MHELIGNSAGTILWWQECIRAIVIFVCGLAMIRLFGRRAFGEQTPLDILLAIIVGSNLSRALTANAAFLPTIAGTLAMLVLYWVFIHAAARWPVFGRILKGRSVPLVRDGSFDPQAMRQAGVSKADVAEAARNSSVKEGGAIDEATLERSGKISVVPRK